MSRPSYMFDLPRTFDPAEFLPTRLLTRADDARWLVSTILRNRANRDVDPWNWFRLHSDIVRRVMDGRAAPEIIRSLAEGGAIKTVAYHPVREAPATDWQIATMPTDRSACRSLIPGYGTASSASVSVSTQRSASRAGYRSTRPWTPSNAS